MAGLSFFGNIIVSDYSSMGRVWNLFSELGRRSNEEILIESREGDPNRFQFFERLIHNATKGVNYSLREDGIFSLRAYDYAVRQRDTINRFKELQKCIYLVNEIDKGGSDDVSDGYGEFSENRLIEEKNEYEEVEMKIDYFYCWGMFPELVKVSSALGYDLCELLSLALGGNSYSLKTLSNLSQEYPPVQEFLEGVLIPDRLGDVVNRLLEFGGG